jgi:hypothetical protein
MLFSYIMGRYAKGQLEATVGTGSRSNEDGGPLVPHARCAISDQ